MLRRIGSGFRSLAARIRHHGPQQTWEWFRGHVCPCLSGIPSPRFSHVGDGLYVGAQLGRLGRLVLRRLGIHASVNMRSEFDDVTAGVALPNHLHLPTPDLEPPTLTQLVIGVAFIRHAMTAGGVYVHCQSGVGRAPTMAVAYLVSTGFAIADAVERVRRVRPFIELTRTQRDRLVRFEEVVLRSELGAVSGPTDG